MLSPETGVSSTDNTISTQQSPDGGQFPFISPELSESEYNTLAQEPLSWTNATVSSSEGNGVSDSDPAAANAGDGTVSISYGYTAVYQGMDLTGQVYLHWRSEQLSEHGSLPRRAGLMTAHRPGSALRAGSTAVTW